MAGSLIGALRVALGLDTAQFDTGASQAEKRAEQLGARIGEALRAPVGSAISLKNAIIALGGAATVKSLFDLGKRALDYASSLDEVSQQLGVTSKDLQTYRYIASQVGISQEEMDKGLSKLTVTMGQARAGVQKPADTFKELSNILGKDILKSAGTAGDAIPLIADAMAKIPDPTKRAALEVALFGKTGQKLDTMLSGGGDAINQLKKAAQDLGLVLSDSQIQNADAAADKLSELKQVLSADIASVVSDNAKAIYSFADALEHLIPKMLAFLKANPQEVMTFAGAIAGGMQGGVVGAGFGAVGGYYTGSKVAQALADNNMDLSYRKKAYEEARNNYHSLASDGAQPNGGSFLGIKYHYDTSNGATKSGATRETALAEYRRQLQLFQQAVNAARHPATTPGVTGFHATGAGQTPGDRSAAAKAKADAARAAREAEQQRKKELADQRAYDADLGRTRSEHLAAQEALTPNIVEQAILQKQQLLIEADARFRSIETNEKYSRAQKDELEGYEQKIAALKLDAIDREKIAKLQQQALDSAQAERDNQSDVLRAQESLAKTAKERLRIELDLLDLQYQNQKAQEQLIIDDKANNYTPQQKADATARSNTLDQLYPLQRTQVMQQNQGPLGQYLDSIPKSADEMNEALQGVAVDGLQNLNDGIVNAITNAKSLADVFSNVAKQIIADLAKIAIEKAVIAPLGNALSGLFGGSGLDISSNISSISSSLAASNRAGFASILSGARAGGGPVVGGKNYLVGEQGPEIFTPDHSGSIISNDNIPMSQKGFTQHINYSGAVDVADKSYVQQMAIQTAAATKTALREESRRAAGRG